MLSLTVRGFGASIEWLDASYQSPADQVPLWRLMRAGQVWEMSPSEGPSDNVGFDWLAADLPKLPGEMIIRMPLSMALPIDIDRRRNPVGWALRRLAERHPGLSVSLIDGRVNAVAPRLAVADDDASAHLIYGLADSMAYEAVPGLPPALDWRAPQDVLGGAGDLVGRSVLRQRGDERLPEPVARPEVAPSWVHSGLGQVVLRAVDWLASKLSEGAGPAQRAEHTWRLVRLARGDVVDLVWHQILGKARWNGESGEAAWHAARGQSIPGTKDRGQRALWIFEAVIVVLSGLPEWDRLGWDRLDSHGSRMTVTFDGMRAIRTVAAVWRSELEAQWPHGLQELVRLGIKEVALAVTGGSRLWRSAWAQSGLVAGVVREVLGRADSNGLTGVQAWLDVRDAAGSGVESAASADSLRAEWVLMGVVAALSVQPEWVELPWNRAGVVRFPVGGGQELRWSVGQAFAKLQADRTGPAVIGGGWGLLLSVLQAALGDDGQLRDVATDVVMGRLGVGGLPGEVVWREGPGLVQDLLGLVRAAVIDGLIPLDLRGRARLMGAVDVPVVLEHGVEWVRLGAVTESTVGPSVPNWLGPVVSRAVGWLASTLSEGAGPEQREQHKWRLVGSAGGNVVNQVWHQILSRASWGEELGELAWLAADRKLAQGQENQGQRGLWVIAAVVAVLSGLPEWDQLDWKRPDSMSITIDGLRARRPLGAVWRDVQASTELGWLGLLMTPLVRFVASKLSEGAGPEQRAEHKRRLVALARGADVVDQVWQQILGRARWNGDSGEAAWLAARGKSLPEASSGQRASWVLDAVVAVLSGLPEWDRLDWLRDTLVCVRLDGLQRQRRLHVVWRSELAAQWPVGLQDVVRLGIREVALAVEGGIDRWDGLGGSAQFGLVAVVVREVLGRAGWNGLTGVQAWCGARDALESGADPEVASGAFVDSLRAGWVLMGVVAALSVQPEWVELPWNRADVVRFPVGDGQELRWSVGQALAALHAEPTRPEVDGFQPRWGRARSELVWLVDAVRLLGSADLARRLAGDLGDVQEGLVRLRGEVLHGGMLRGVAGDLTDFERRLRRVRSELVVVAGTAVPSAGWRSLRTGGFGHDEGRVEIFGDEQGPVVLPLRDRGKSTIRGVEWELRLVDGRLEMWPPAAEEMLTMVAFDPQVDLGPADRLVDLSARQLDPESQIDVPESLVDRLLQPYAWAWVALSASAPDRLVSWRDPLVSELAARVGPGVDDEAAREATRAVARLLFPGGLGGSASSDEVRQYPRPRSQAEAGPSQPPGTYSLPSSSQLPPTSPRMLPNSPWMSARRPSAASSIGRPGSRGSASSTSSPGSLALGVKDADNRVTAAVSLTREAPAPSLWRSLGSDSPLAAVADGLANRDLGPVGGSRGVGLSDVGHGVDVVEGNVGGVWVGDGSDVRGVLLPAHGWSFRSRSTWAHFGSGLALVLVEARWQVRLLGLELGKGKYVAPEGWSLRFVQVQDGNGWPVRRYVLESVDGSARRPHDLGVLTAVGSVPGNPLGLVEGETPAPPDRAEDPVEWLLWQVKLWDPTVVPYPARVRAVADDLARLSDEQANAAVVGFVVELGRQGRGVGGGDRFGGPRFRPGDVDDVFGDVFGRLRVGSRRALAEHAQLVDGAWHVDVGWWRDRPNSSDMVELFAGLVREGKADLIVFHVRFTEVDRLVEERRSVEGRRWWGVVEDWVRAATPLGANGVVFPAVGESWVVLPQEGGRPLVNGRALMSDQPWPLGGLAWERWESWIDDLMRLLASHDLVAGVPMRLVVLAPGASWDIMRRLGDALAVALQRCESGRQVLFSAGSFDATSQLKLESAGGGVRSPRRSELIVARGQIPVLRPFEARTARGSKVRRLFLSAHGGWHPDSGDAVVPDGYTVHFYSSHGEIQTALFFHRMLSSGVIVPVESRSGGEYVKNYSLSPDDSDLDMAGIVSAWSALVGGEFVSVEHWIAPLCTSQSWCTAAGHDCDGIFGKLPRSRLSGQTGPAEIHLLICRSVTGERSSLPRMFSESAEPREIDQYSALSSGAASRRYRRFLLDWVFRRGDPHPVDLIRVPQATLGVLNLLEPAPILSSAFEVTAALRPGGGSLPWSFQVWISSVAGNRAAAVFELYDLVSGFDGTAGEVPRLLEQFALLPSTNTTFLWRGSTKLSAAVNDEVRLLAAEVSWHATPKDDGRYADDPQGLRQARGVDLYWPLRAALDVEIADLEAQYQEFLGGLRRNARRSARSIDFELRSHQGVPVHGDRNERLDAEGLYARLIAAHGRPGSRDTVSLWVTAHDGVYVAQSAVRILARDLESLVGRECSAWMRNAPNFEAPWHPAYPPGLLTRFDPESQPFGAREFWGSLTDRRLMGDTGDRYIGNRDVRGAEALGLPAVDVVGDALERLSVGPVSGWDWAERVELVDGVWHVDLGWWGDLVELGEVHEKLSEKVRGGLDRLVRGGGSDLIVFHMRFTRRDSVEFADPGVLPRSESGLWRVVGEWVRVVTPWGVNGVVFPAVGESWVVLAQNRGRPLVDGQPVALGDRVDEGWFDGLARALYGHDRVAGMRMRLVVLAPGASWHDVRALGDLLASGLERRGLGRQVLFSASSFNATRQLKLESAVRGVLPRRIGDLVNVNDQESILRPFEARTPRGSRVQQLFFPAHGKWYQGSGNAVVPDGYKVHFYNLHGEYQDALLGLGVLSSEPRPVQTYVARQCLPNYSVFPLADDLEMNAIYTVQPARFGGQLGNVRGTFRLCEWPELCAAEGHNCRGMFGKLPRNRLAGQTGPTEIHLLICRTISGLESLEPQRFSGNVDFGRDFFPSVGREYPDYRQLLIARLLEAQPAELMRLPWATLGTLNLICSEPILPLAFDVGLALQRSGAEWTFDEWVARVAGSRAAALLELRDLVRAFHNTDSGPIDWQRRTARLLEWFPPSYWNGRSFLWRGSTELPAAVNSEVRLFASEQSWGARSADGLWSALAVEVGHLEAQFVRFLSRLPDSASGSATSNEVEVLALRGVPVGSDPTMALHASQLYDRLLERHAPLNSGHQVSLWVTAYDGVPVDRSAVRSLARGLGSLVGQEVLTWIRNAPNFEATWHPVHQPDLPPLEEFTMLNGRRVKISFGFLDVSPLGHDSEPVDLVVLLRDGEPVKVVHEGADGRYQESLRPRELATILRRRDVDQSAIVYTFWDLNTYRRVPMSETLWPWVDALNDEVRLLRMSPPVGVTGGRDDWRAAYP